jgi:hypothetical protein
MKARIMSAGNLPRSGFGTKSEETAVNISSSIQYQAQQALRKRRRLPPSMTSLRSKNLRLSARMSG